MEESGATAARETRLRGKESISGDGIETRRGAGARVALEILIVADAVAFVVASAVHFGSSIPLGFTTVSDVTLLPAGIAEGVIGVVFAAAAALVFTRASWAWNGTLAAYLLGIVGVAIGIGVSAGDSGDSSPANLLFHLSILPVLVAGLALLLTRGGRAGLGKAPRTRTVVP